jgi:hypothetical protein
MRLAFATAKFRVQINPDWSAAVPKLTEKQRNCLEDYDRPEDGREPTSDVRWNRRQMHWALENDLLMCGPAIGAHILSEKGKQALADGFLEFPRAPLSQRNAR